MRILQKSNIWPILALVVLCILAGPRLLRNIVNITVSVRTGEIHPTDPGPLYGYMHVPASSPEFETASNALAADFANAFFPSKKFFSGESIYKEVNDPWGRLPTFPPIAHYIVRFLSLNMDYGTAAIVHLYLQVAILIIATFYYVTKYTGRIGIAAATSLLLSYLIFATPVGLAWFERGQFDLYVASAIMLAAIGMLESSAIAIGLSAILASMKWTAFPFVFVSIGVYVLCHKSKYRKFFYCLLYGTIVFACLAVFPKYLIDYPKIIVGSERGDLIEGVSLLKLLPWWFAKWYPFVLVILFAVLYRLLVRTNSVKRFSLVFMPLLLGAGLMTTTYATSCYEYRAVALLGLVPPLIVWNTKTKMHRSYRMLVSVIFGSSLLIVLRFIECMDKKLAMNEQHMILIYMFFGFALVMSSFLMPLRDKIVRARRRLSTKSS